MSEDCLFCKILKNEIPSTKIFENENVYGFVDIHPQAKEHFLFIHKNHSKNVLEMDEAEISQVFLGMKEFLGNEESFRVVTNCGELAGQTVFHTHFHLLKGEKLKGFGS